MSAITITTEQKLRLSEEAQKIHSLGVVSSYPLEAIINVIAANAKVELVTDGDRKFVIDVVEKKIKTPTAIDTTTTTSGPSPAATPQMASATSALAPVSLDLPQQPAGDKVSPVKPTATDAATTPEATETSAQDAAKAAADMYDAIRKNNPVGAAYGMSEFMKQFAANHSLSDEETLKLWRKQSELWAQQHRAGQQPAPKQAKQQAQPKQPEPSISEAQAQEVSKGVKGSFPTQAPRISCYEYLKNLFVTGDRVCTMQIHATNKNPDGTSVTITSFQSLEELVDESSDFNATVAKAERAGWNMYVCMSPVTQDSWNRKKGNVADIRAVYAEVDENGVATREEINKAATAGEIPKPHCVIESSPSKFQFVWFAKDFTPETQEQLNSSLQVRFNTDPQSVDCVRVLRLPGFKNVKPKYAPNYPVSQIVEWNEAPRYTPADFHIQLADLPQHTSGDPLPPDEIADKMMLLLSYLDEQSAAYSRPVKYNEDLKSELKECPWWENHSSPKERGGAAVFVQADGKLGFGTRLLLGRLRVVEGFSRPKEK